MTQTRNRLLAMLVGVVAATSMISMACTESEDGTSTPTAEATASETVGTSGEEPLLVEATTVPAGFEDQLDAWVTADGPASDEVPAQWDERAVVEGYVDYFNVPCEGVEGPSVQDGLASFPGDEGSRACFDEAVAGETAEAIAFLHSYGQFLTAFEEIGTVDLGTIGAAWVNMGRGEPAFLNGAASMVPVSWLLFGGDQRPYEAWLEQPGYQEAIAGHADAIPWAEYTTIEAGASSADGQTFLLSIPLRDCRACEDLASIRVEYRFDGSGALNEYALLPPGTP